MAYLSVCSDPTVKRGVDQWVLRQSDLDFPVTTDSDTVRRFLSGRYRGTRLVFCTYQSAEVLAAGMPARFRFDIGVFDEAHKTAGRVGQKFGFALSDKNLRIKKRVFMTATPRHYHPLKKDAQGDHTLVYSMDEPKVYGPIVHELTFAEAAKKDIVCDYKVLISVATTEMVSEVLRNRGEVLIEGDLVKVRQVANQIAIQRAVEEHGVSKIISFHNSIAAAKSFTSDLPEGIGTHLPDFESFHVNGSIPTAAREALMSEFRDSDKGIVSNARCLTEGVDVPVVDMVAFMAPKRSHIDIVQAVGRAMRNVPDKEIGYVLVPLYLEMDKNEGIEETLERSDFTHVADVLNAIKTQDETLADVMREMRTERGRTGGFDDSRLRGHVEVLGPAITLPLLHEGIATWVVDQLGVTWDERFGELLAYRETHGDCLVPKTSGKNPPLAIWVSNLRKRRSKLTEDQIRRLDEIGFVWDALAFEFEQMNAALVAYQREHGDCLVPAGWPQNTQLATWVATRRRCRSKLPEDQIRRLDEIGFVWDVATFIDGRRYEQLAAYKKGHGDCLVPARWPENPQLGRWVADLRERRRQHLNEDQLRRLDEIGFVWDVPAFQFEQMYAALVAYKSDHGDCLVPSGWSEDPQLGRWVTKRRGRRSKLSEDQLRRLDEIGFVWDVPAFQFEQMYAALVTYKSDHGDCLVPRTWPQNTQLGSWVLTLPRRASKLTEDQIRRLDEIGFVWDITAFQFERMYLSLVAYKSDHGDCLVPRKWSKNPQLGSWVANLRTQRSKLPEDPIRRLDEIGFVWDVPAFQFEQMYAALVAYQREHGDCLVPRTRPQNTQLATWVSNLRTRRSKHTEDQIRRLDEIGFVWGAHAVRFEQMYAALVAYQRAHGDCLVPSNWPENPQLSTWVVTVRARRSKLTEDQTRKLDEIGFVWNSHAFKFDQRYEALVAYKTEYGDCLVPDRWKNRQLASWVYNLRKRRSKLTKDQLRKLDEIGFVWRVR